jgi:hypothetical protein
MYIFKSLLFIISVIILINCSNNSPKTQSNTPAVTTEVEKDTIPDLNEEVQLHKTSVLIVQCSNGYEYATGGYDFNPILEQELVKNLELVVIPFPYKTLMGVIYQGVYDKKYAQPIIEKVDVDILIMTRFIGNVFPEMQNQSDFQWGYETKILNTSTMEQKVSIRASKLKNYDEIINHISANSDRLASDIKSMTKK